MIISVASGKGGTGKTTVSTALAVALSDKPLQFLDCDVEEPNAHIFLKPDIAKIEKVNVPVPRIDESKCTHCGTCSEVCCFNALAVLEKQVMLFENLCHGCGACMLACPENAISEGNREIGVIESGTSNGISFAHGKLNIGEAMSPPLIRALKKKITGDTDVVLDVPPGTSCPVVESVKGSDFVLLVTEPTPFGLNDLKLAVEMLRILGLPHAVIVNRADVGDKAVDDYCKAENVPIIMRIPFDRKIAESYSRGGMLLEAVPELMEKFLEVYRFASGKAVTQ